MNYILFTQKSSNAKTGKIPVSMSQEKTCPSVCPLKKQGCYAKYSYLGWHWKNIETNDRALSFNDFCLAISNLPDNTIWRHNQAGDLNGRYNKLSRRLVLKLAKANIGKKGFTYTHYPVLDHKYADFNRRIIKEAISLGFVINLSSENFEQAERMVELGIAPVTTLLSDNNTKYSYTSKGIRVVTCPATYIENLTCKDCKMCAKSKRNFIIGFPIHGAGKQKIKNVGVGESR